MKLGHTAALTLLIIVVPVRAQEPLGAAFAYQGRLMDAGIHADGTYFMQFGLFDVAAGGTALQLQPPAGFAPVAVSGGLFSAMLDFDPAHFDGRKLWVEVNVEGAVLAPRQALAATPHAVAAQKLVVPLTQAASVGNVSMLTFRNTLAGAPFAMGAQFWSASSNGVAGFHDDPGAAGAMYINSNAGISGASDSGPGVYGRSTLSTGVGVHGRASDDPAVTSIGVLGTNDGPGRGVVGESRFGQAVYGDSETHDGVFGLSRGGEGRSGVYGASLDPTGFGVFGHHVSTSGTAPGVHGETNSVETNASAVLGVVRSASPGGGSAAVRGVNHGTTVSGYGVHGSHDGSGRGVFGQSVDGWGVYGSGNGDSGPPTTSGGVRCIGNFYQSAGQFRASPTSTVWTTNKPATVKLDSGEPVKLFAEEAAEVFFCDYGAGRLNDGRARIALDPRFAQTVTVSDEFPMMVFVQVEGECEGVFVLNKSATGFDVVELRGGRSSAAFSYRVVCRRRHYEGLRLPDEARDRAANERMLAIVWPETLAADAAARRSQPAGAARAAVPAFDPDLQDCAAVRGATPISGEVVLPAATCDGAAQRRRGVGGE